MIVYKVQFPNKKCYIGITSKSLETRKRLHFNEARHSNFKFHNALNKYAGTESWDVIDNSATTWEELKELEKWYIKFFDSFYNGYNSTIGGDGMLGLKHSEESRQKMKGKRPQTSTSLLGKKKSEQHRKNLSKARTGLKLSEEGRQKLSKALKIHKADINIRNKAALAGGGKPFKVYKLKNNKIITKNTKINQDELLFVGDWISQRECARILKLDQSKISGCLKNKLKVHKGYVFKFADIEDNHAEV